MFFHIQNSNNVVIIIINNIKGKMLTNVLKSEQM